MSFWKHFDRGFAKFDEAFAEFDKGFGDYIHDKAD